MDFGHPASSSKNLCYVRCNFCNTILAVGIPCKSLVDTVSVKCGQCSNLSFLTTTTRPHPLLLQQPQLMVDRHYPLPLPLPLPLPSQGFSSDQRKGQSTQTLTSSSTSTEQLSPKAPFVVKPPEKKHRLPSAYNQFMKEEIQRIKVANPEIPHREAFSTAAKNWARYVPTTGSTPENNNKNVSAIDFVVELSPYIFIIIDFIAKLSPYEGRTAAHIMERISAAKGIGDHFQHTS
ncbi:protein CRABS CLAW-like [Telopea speciosissima]|uniref:protein CRABS CLAW-like n=1 Tax=Telopea speciosissima TaxID=54955 RepID=UPI001CC479E2|nr:protein CRABS CLAW-like [Telopea speciosissima]